MIAIMQNRGLVLISVLLVVLTGVVIFEGEQMVDQLKTGLKEPHKLELVKENTHTGESG